MVSGRLSNHMTRWPPAVSNTQALTRGFPLELYIMALMQLITRKRVKAKPQDIEASSGHSHRLWLVRRHSNVGDICFGRAASGIYSGIRRIVRLGVDIWVPARRLAIWSRRSDLGVGCRPPLVEKGVESVSISGQPGISPASQRCTVTDSTRAIARRSAIFARMSAR